LKLHKNVGLHVEHINERGQYDIIFKIFQI
jgi:hypothetical protein